MTKWRTVFTALVVTIILLLACSAFSLPPPAEQPLTVNMEQASIIATPALPAIEDPSIRSTGCGSLTPVAPTWIEPSQQPTLSETQEYAPTARSGTHRS